MSNFKHLSGAEGTAEGSFPPPVLLTAWWETSFGEWFHISDLTKDPTKRLLLPLLDQLALELELHAERSDG